MKRWYAFGMLASLLLALVAGFATAAQAAGPGDVVISTAYPWVVADKGKPVTFNLEIANNGKDYKQMDLQVVDGPQDWQPAFKDLGYSIKTVIVAPGKSQSLQFQAQPPNDAKASDYGFALKAVGTDGADLSDLKVKISLQDTVSSGIKFSTQYPNIRGQAGTAFSFKMDLTNSAGQDRTVSFTSNAPQDWEIAFKPSYDTKEVTSIGMKAGDTQSVDVSVTTPQKVEAGDYEVKVAAFSGSDRVEAPLKVTILGQYKLSLDTSSGQLNAKATVDQTSSTTMVVKNTGASTIQNLALTATKPDGWDITFSPDKIDSLAPDQSREVTVNMKPGSRTLAGDYMVGITASGGTATDNKQLRVTVDTPTTWGFAGIALIVIVLGGLGYMFARLSRR